MPLVRALSVMCIRISSAAIGEAVERFVQQEDVRFLRQGGDPYDFSIKDPTGEVGINFGVYGVPETFVIDKKGVIRYKQIGPITPEAWDKKIHPLINQLKTE